MRSVPAVPGPGAGVGSGVVSGEARGGRGRQVLMCRPFKVCAYAGTLVKAKFAIGGLLPSPPQLHSTTRLSLFLIFSHTHTHGTRTPVIGSHARPHSRCARHAPCEHVVQVKRHCRVGFDLYLRLRRLEVQGGHVSGNVLSPDFARRRTHGDTLSGWLTLMCLCAGGVREARGDVIGARHGA